ncbi:transposase [Patescibacteria group bacterium]|nr:transposase [Patescibacteria group bacterium]
MRKVKFVNEEYYHIYNRGVDKRTIFQDLNDIDRFFQGMQEFNVIESIGSIYVNTFRKNKLRHRVSKDEKLVDFVCYCLIPNHYHFILQQLIDKGIEKFMHKLGMGHAKFFNSKYKRSGALFQGKFKAIHVDSNEYLLHLSAYVNLNYKVHNWEQKFGNRVPKLIRSSWEEYIGENKENFCKKDIILDQFGSGLDYKKFAEDSLESIKENKEIKKFLLE